MSFNAAILFPFISTITLINMNEVTLVIAVIRLLLMSFLTLVGALLMAAILSENDFMLKFDQFIGVKLAYFLPPFFTALYFSSKFQNDNIDINLITLSSNYHIIIFILTFLILVYFRNSGKAAPIVRVERKIRKVLDTLLRVRPRAKEFLIGHPVMLILLSIGYNDNSLLPYLILGNLGQVSIINSFAHFHTPLNVSLRRTINGLLIGTIIGMIIWLIKFCN